jgi:O-antigen ligase
LTVAWSLTFPRGLGRHLWAVAAVLDIALLPMTASRGGALATALLLLTAVGLSLSRRNYLAEPALGRLWRRLALLGVGVGTLAFVITLVVSPPHVVRLVRTFDLAGTAGVGAGRLMLYQRVLENVPRYPLGLGLGSILSPAAGFGNFAHNTFLQILAELGIPGVLLYLWLVFETLRAAARHHTGTTYSVWLVSISLGLLSTYYAGLTLSMYYDEFFALFWGLLMVGNRLAEEELAARRRAEDTALIPAPAS